MSVTTKICAADGCGNPIPPSKRFDARYCSRKCVNRTAQRRRRAKQGKTPPAG